MAENWSDIKASKKKDLKLSDEDIRIIYGQKELDKRKAKRKKSRTQMKNSTEGKRLKRMEDKLKKLGL